MNIKQLESKVKSKKTGTIANMYVYGTEMISDYYSKINLKNKKVLTIIGSGDQIINAIFFGAKEVVGFDYNILSQHIFYLKIAAIKTLNYQEFFDFFGKKHNNGSFNYKLYLKIRKVLNKNTLKFFDEVYKYFKFNGDNLPKSGLINNRQNLKKYSVKDINAYLKNKKTYEKIKKLIIKKKMRIIIKDIRILDTHLKEKFDVINLSNIPNYLTKYELQDIESSVETFYKTILLKLRRILKPNGKIMFYSFSDKDYPSPNSKIPPALNRSRNINLIKKKKEFRTEFKNTRGIFDGRDKVWILNKHKK